MTSDTNKYTAVKPYNESETKTSQLSRMFNNISKRYDAFNGIMTWGMVKIWRKKALKSLKKHNPKFMLDIATGTGDVAIQAYKYLNPNKVTGIDISDKMLDIARKKAAKANLDIQFEVQDSANLKFTDSSFDAVTISFGIRNFEKLDQSIHEIHRVLKTEGHFMILEMNEPNHKLLLPAYKIYTKLFVWLSSRMLSNDTKAYDYLQNSMHVFASGNELIEIIEPVGFELERYNTFGLGVCSLYVFSKR